VPVSAADHLLGASHAPVTVVEYGDFECPNCKQAAPAVKHLLTRFAGRLRVVYRTFRSRKSIRTPCTPQWRQKQQPARASSGRCMTAVREPEPSQGEPAA
jgi:protein-disulfide isomerase